MGGHYFDLPAIPGLDPAELHVNELLFAADDGAGSSEDAGNRVLNRPGPAREAAGEVAGGPVIAIRVQLGAAGAAVAPPGPEGQWQPEAPSE